MLSPLPRCRAKAESLATLSDSVDSCIREDGDYGAAGDEESEGRARKGLSTGLAALFLLAEMAGAGILSLPQAVANTGEALLLGGWS